MQLREFLPKTLFGRMLSIILVPMIFVQVITVFIFYERHWDTVTRHMAQNLAGEMALLVSDIGTIRILTASRPSPKKAGNISAFRSIFRRVRFCLPPRLPRRKPMPKPCFGGN
jgi:hypothetical protein